MLPLRDFAPLMAELMAIDALIKAPRRAGD
jgi:hypothetical protein